MREDQADLSVLSERVSQDKLLIVWRLEMIDEEKPQKACGSTNRYTYRVTWEIPEKDQEHPG